MAESQGPSDQQGSPETQNISNTVVRIYKEMFGRGPMKARTNYAGPDTIVSTMENTMTPAERSMAEAGEHHRLRDVRLYFQHGSQAEFRTAIERITGRKVRAFVSGMDVEMDVATQVFYMEPLTSG